MGGLSVLASSNVGEVAVELLPTGQRTYSSEQLGLMWRDATGPIPEAVDIDFSMSIMNPGSDIDIQLVAADLNRLRTAAALVKQRLREYAGVYEVSDSFRAGKEQMKLGIRPEAETLGLTLQDLGRQVRQAFYGEEAQRIQRGRDDIRVVVRYPRDERRSLGNLENMRIRTPAGGEVPISQVAVVEPGRGFASIRRVDGNRAVNVTASVDPSVTSAGDVIGDLDARVMFALLAVPLKSCLQPFIIMSAVPFGLIGAVWGHILLDLNLSMMSLFGLLALTGIVVNDSLIFVDFINRARSELRWSVHGSDGGLARLRRSVRDHHHPDPRADVVHDPRRCRPHDARRTPREQGR